MTSVFSGMNTTVDTQAASTQEDFKYIQDNIESAADDPGEMLKMQWKMTLWNISHQAASKTQQEAGSAMKSDLQNANTQ